MNLTDNLLDEILHRRKSGYPSVLVDDKYQVVASLLHLIQQIIDSLCFGNQMDRAKKF